MRTVVIILEGRNEESAASHLSDLAHDTAQHSGVNIGVGDTGPMTKQGERAEVLAAYDAAVVDAKDLGDPEEPTGVPS